eukprot:CFRG6987T1
MSAHEETVTPERCRNMGNDPVHATEEPKGCFSVAKSRGRYAFGLLLLLCVVVIWVGSSELMKYIYSSSAASRFSKPFYLTFYNTAMFSVYLPGFLFKESWRQQIPTWDEFRQYINANICRCFRVTSSVNLQFDGESLMDDNEMDGSDDNIGNSADDDSLNAIPSDSIPQTDNEPPMTMMEVVHTASSFCLLWFAANYTFNLAITLTSVAAVTIISSTSGFFTMMLEQVFFSDGHEGSGFSIFKAIMIFLSVVGVGFVSLSDTHKNDDGPSTRLLTGDLTALLSAALYGCYLVFLECRAPLVHHLYAQKKIGNEERVNMMMFFGFVGLFNVLFLWPMFIILHVTGVETFEIPSSTTLAFITVNALIGTVLSDYLWIYSTLLTSPLVATLGLSLTIPTAVMVDYLWGNVDIDSGFMLGMFLVLGAFVGINLASYLPLLEKLYEWMRGCCGTKFASLFLGHSPEKYANSPTIHEV